VLEELKKAAEALGGVFRVGYVNFEEMARQGVKVPVG